MEKISTILGTYCGAQINATARVLNIFGGPIAGLYAAGEVMGGVLREGYINGTALGKALIFGYIAGRNAAMGKT